MRTNLKVIRMVASLSILSYLRSTVRFMLVPPTDDKRDQRNDQEHIQPQWNNPPLRVLRKSQLGMAMDMANNPMVSAIRRKF